MNEDATKMNDHFMLFTQRFDPHIRCCELLRNICGEHGNEIIVAKTVGWEAIMKKVRGKDNDHYLVVAFDNMSTYENYDLTNFKR